MKMIEGNIQPLPDKVLVRDLQFGEMKTKGGVILMDDDGKEYGIKPRWAKVWKVGENIVDINPGEWILIEHGRWSRTLTIEENNEKIKINLVDYPEGVLLVSDRLPE